MSRNYKFLNQEKLYFVSFATVNWIDVFTRSEYKDIVVNSLQFCSKNKGLEVYAWCIMSNHVHLIIGTQKDMMQDTMRDLKGFSSKQLLKAIENNPNESRKEWMLWMFKRSGEINPNNEKYQLWQQHNHPIELFDNTIMQQKLDYIHMNPVVSGIVDEPWEYKYSSARDYSGKRGLIGIKFIE